MNLPSKLLPIAILSGTAASFAASIPKTVLPDNVVTCEPTTGCVDQTFYGRTYKVIVTPRFTVMVSVSREGMYTRADVSVTNNSGLPLSVTPEDFRVEVVTPKPKILLYVPPSALNLPTAQPAAHLSAASNLQTTAEKVPVAPDAAGAVATTSVTADATPEVDSQEAAEQRVGGEQEAVDKARAQQNLAPTSIGPNEVTRGRVYFESDKKANLVNVVIPLAGVVFEFPYALKGKQPNK